jgi:hypothetical protein
MTHDGGGSKDVDSNSGSGEQLDDNAECQPQIGQLEPREDQVNDVVLN